MYAIRELPVRHKLTCIILVTSMVALVLACVAVTIFDQVSFRGAMQNDLTTLADVIGGNATAALSFGDARAAQEVLSALRFKPHVRHACIYTPDGQPFAQYPATGALTDCPALRSKGTYHEHGSLQLFDTILLAGEPVGTMYIESDLNEAAMRLRRYLAVSLVIVLAVSVTAFLLGARLQRLISNPILALVEMVRQFSARQNYSVSLPENSRDELKLLVSGFTGMLEQIQKRDRELQWHNDQLNEARQSAERSAVEDPLTKLPNRRLFLERLTFCLQRAERHPGYLCALLFLDMDRFKVINDSLGHQAGDELLIEVANRLRHCVRRIDTVSRYPGGEDVVARLGGDEFAVLLDDIQDVSDAIRVADRIGEGLRPPVRLRGKDVSINVSIGITTSASHYRTAETMLRDADTAMYRAKSGGGGSVIFDQIMHSQALERLHLESELRQALERGEFVNHYQPIISLPDEQIVGFESLLRWQSPQRGIVSPAEFIPIAEETGLIVPLGAWVLRESCQQIRRWRQRFGTRPMFNVNVNISARQFLQPDLVRLVAECLEEARIEGQALCLELTESVAMKDAERTRRMLDDLRLLGVRLSIDDFGTGYSSLDHLFRFPVEALKIDRSFVSNMGLDERNQQLVRTIISMAHNLQMKVIAEGAETAQQVSLLNEMQCDCVQGFFHYRPMPAEKVEFLLESCATQPGQKAASMRAPAA